MTKKVAILQSNYIPWKGYFDMIASVDEFILYDDMQYTRRDWRNRNKIKTAQGLQWLTVPVITKGRYHQLIRETQISDVGWGREHWRTIIRSYKKTKFFDEIATWLEPIYIVESFVYLSALNRRLIEAICQYLNITTVIKNSWDYTLVEGKTERLVNLCVQAGGSEYVSGRAAENYIDEPLFKEQDIRLIWFDYSGYSSYPQLWGEFCHEVSILDLLFNCGKNSTHYMRYLPS